MKERYFLYRSAVVASLAGFLFGFDTVVISGAEQSIQALWQLSDGMHGVAVSMAIGREPCFGSGFFIWFQLWDPHWPLRFSLSCSSGLSGASAWGCPL